jgi:hypothetical protein
MSFLNWLGKRKLKYDPIGDTGNLDPQAVAVWQGAHVYVKDGLDEFTGYVVSVDPLTEKAVVEDERNGKRTEHPLATLHRQV